MSIILNRLFLAVWLDECSFIDSDEIREAAYTASLLYSAPKMRDFCPTIEELPLAVRRATEYGLLIARSWRPMRGSRE